MAQVDYFSDIAGGCVVCHHFGYLHMDGSRGIRRSGGRVTALRVMDWW